MYILASLPEEHPTVSLEEPDDCRRFQVTVRGLSEETARQVLEDQDVGQLSDHDTAWITITAIRKLAHGRVQPDWSERFSAMLEYAGRKSWLSENRECVQGHCEWI